MATAKKQANGKYRIQIYAGKDASGKRIYESFTSTKTGIAGKREVENAAANWALDRKEREKSSVQNLAEAMDKYIDTCRAQGISPSTIRGYVSVAKNVSESLKCRKLSCIQITDVQHELDARAKSVSPKTLRNELGFISAVMHAYAPDIDLRPVKIARQAKRAKRIIRNTDMQAVLEAAKSHTEIYLYILFTMQLGLRMSESYALTWGDISAEPMTMIDHGERLEYGTVSVTKARVKGEFGYEEKAPKTESGTRIVSASWAFFEALYAAKPRGKDSAHILTMQPASASRAFAQIRDQVGLPDTFRLYDLRHYFASTLILSGATDEVIAANMGHSSASITHAIYAEIIGENNDTVNANMIRSGASMLSSQNSAEKATFG